LHSEDLCAKNWKIDASLDCSRSQDDEYIAFKSEKLEHQVKRYRVTFYIKLNVTSPVLERAGNSSNSDTLSSVTCHKMCYGVVSLKGEFDAEKTDAIATVILKYSSQPFIDEVNQKSKVIAVPLDAVPEGRAGEEAYKQESTCLDETEAFVNLRLI